LGGKGLCSITALDFLSRISVLDFWQQPQGGYLILKSLKLEEKPAEVFYDLLID
jgi:hypothetical protein